MRIAVYGAGASGGHFAVRLACAGHAVSVIARGAHLAAIRKEGLRLRSGDEDIRAMVRASDGPDDLGRQDVVIVATKATALPAIAANIAPLIGDATLVIFPQNGMTWWYPVGLPERHPTPPPLPIFDLGKPFLAAMRSNQVIGGITYSANEIEAPGLIRNNSPHHNRLELAPILDRAPPALADIRRSLEQAGILSPDPGDIRAALWTKLLTNVSGSALGLVTASSSDGARKDRALAEIYRRVAREMMAVAAAHGYPLALDPEELIAKLLNHKASLLQDFEQGRPMEIGEIVLAPLAFARAAGVATPTLDTVAAIATKLAADRGLFAGIRDTAIFWHDTAL